ncbi:MAG TPA: DNA-directed RNA polymerase subunit alpha [Campylobacterales bacterium]|nr:DNA-directed RNA polymerase subunit alpha [Campylobacterales bacterium]
MKKIKTAPLVPSQFEVEEIGENAINVKVAPFEVGFAISIAHPLKRFLLSSSVGYAPIAIKVENASHEFDNIPGMLEDISAFILNLKHIRFKLKDGIEKIEVSYSFKGSKDIYGSDLETDEVEVVTPNSFLASLNEDGELDFTLVIYKGIGYVPSEDIRSSIADIYEGFIPLDAYFTPVRKAHYTIENVLVGDDPNFEKIVFHVETDGQVSPREVFGEVLETFKKQIAIFENIANSSVSTIVQHSESGEVVITRDRQENEPPLSPEEEEILSKLLLGIKEIGLKPRVANTLISAEYLFVGDVVLVDDRELKEIRNFGTGSIADLRMALDKLGLGEENKELLSDKIMRKFRKLSESKRNGDI